MGGGGIMSEFRTEDFVGRYGDLSIEAFLLNKSRAGTTSLILWFTTELPKGRALSHYLCTLKNLATFRRKVGLLISSLPQDHCLDMTLDVNEALGSPLCVLNV